MPAEEKLKMLLDIGEYDFLKDIPQEKLWKLIFLMCFIFGDCKVDVIRLNGKEFAAIDKVFEIVDKLNHNGSISVKLLQKELKALKGEQNERG